MSYYLEASDPTSSFLEAGCPAPLTLDLLQRRAIARPHAHTSGPRQEELFCRGLLHRRCGVSRSNHESPGTDSSATSGGYGDFARFRSGRHGRCDLSIRVSREAGRLHATEGCAGSLPRTLPSNPGTGANPAIRR
jgi:hypothetical protein